MLDPPYKRDGVKGQILDLDTMVKDGVLGGDVDSEVVGNGIVGATSLAAPQCNNFGMIPSLPTPLSTV
ncbi:hypothetical protein GmHk_17G049398 [Glycine max]|nr:hypothetical protein GmHk_17G049398 [Glycine max]